MIDAAEGSRLRCRGPLRPALPPLLPGGTPGNPALPRVPGRATPGPVEHRGAAAGGRGCGGAAGLSHGGGGRAGEGALFAVDIPQPRYT